MRALTRGVALLALAGVAVASPLRAGEPAPRAGGFSLGEVRLLAAPLEGLPPERPVRAAEESRGTGESGAASPSPAAGQKLLDGRTLVVSAGLLAVVPVAGWLTWWKVEEKTSFHFGNERWFQQDTYDGGADKVSHFVVASILEDGLESLYRSMGKDERQARILGVGVVTLGGLLVEAGDGLTRYGFAWEDAATNFLGALTAAELKRMRLDDTIGFRLGIVKYQIPDPCCRAAGYGSDYSKWIHSADLKLKGFLPRVGVAPGPARFFFVSLTYGSKGYRFSPTEVRQRNVGIDLGLNLEEILRAVGTPPDRWWGKVLLGIFRYYRFPYTAVGWRYDLNSGKWHGPDTGDVFDPGSVIYD